MTPNEYLDKRVSELNKKLSASFVRPMTLKEIYKILDPEGKIFGRKENWHGWRRE